MYWRNYIFLLFSVVSSGSPIPWYNGQYAYEIPVDADSDCAQMLADGTVAMTLCSWEDAGMICEVQLT